MPVIAAQLDRHAAVASDDPLLLSRLTPPPQRAGLMARPQLMHSLAQAGVGSLTLVVAPAGYGKTTLLGAWVHKIENEELRIEKNYVKPNPSQFSIFNSQKVAWLTLNRDLNDPARFWAYLAAALRRAAPGLSAALVPQPSLAALTTLLNTLADCPIPLTLILDDYHTVDDACVQRAMAFLLEHLPPRLRLVIAGRSLPPLPLARLRATGRLIELGAEDLRCSAAEAATFLRETLHLPPADAAVLAERTEGWFAGLQLAGLALRGQRGLPAAVRAIAGSQRPIADYLLDEVLDQQPAAIQTFLLRTSILNQMCGELCDAVLYTDLAI